MFDATTMNPAELAAIVESAPQKRGRKAIRRAHPAFASPSAKTPDAANRASQHTIRAPHLDTLYANVDRIVPDWSSGRVATKPYEAAPEMLETINGIISVHRLRQGAIKAQTRLILQAKASVRFAVQQDDDYDTDEKKAAARKRADGLFAEVAKDPMHELYPNIAPYLMAIQPIEAQCEAYKKELARSVKRLPVYEWVKTVKGFGDVSFATIVGECGDIGSYSSFSALWKRMGVAVINGKRQGAPGEGATSDDWINHGYRKPRRSVGYVAREHVIGGMGKWRPLMGEDVHANPDLTYYQRVYAERARLEAVKLELPITESDKGKESYRAHVAMRAHRYVEKLLLKHLYIEWRRA